MRKEGVLSITKHARGDAQQDISHTFNTWIQKP